MFGVFRDRWAGFGLDDPDVNFRGLNLTVRLPSIENVVDARWTVAADLVDCPELILVLPASHGWGTGGLSADLAIGERGNGE